MFEIDTFSANSLKILDKNVDEFQNKYIYNLSLYKKDERAELGQKFHSLICSYIKGYDVSKMLLGLNDCKPNNLNKNGYEVWQRLENVISKLKDGFIKTEYSFLVKDTLINNSNSEGDEKTLKNYYLTGRFDAIYKENEIYTIYDWKTLTLPKNPEQDLQTIVYLYCAAKIFKTELIKMRYLSIEKLEFSEVHFENMQEYKNRIDSIVKKYYENV